ncbi:MAG: DUF2240 family protein [Halobacteriota archaeon]|nr:DUF2240 family protein [Halobacteriota archaeon]
MQTDLPNKQFTVAQPFKKLGKDALTIDEFIFALSLDLEWFTPEEARSLLHQAVSSGLLIMDGEDLKPNFKLKSVKRPADFRPDPDIFTGSVLKKTIDRILDEKGIGREDVIELMNKKEEKFKGIIEKDVLCLLVAKELGVEIEDLVAEAYDSLTSSTQNDLSD